MSEEIKRHIKIAEIWLKEIERIPIQNTHVIDKKIALQALKEFEASSVNIGCSHGNENERP